MKVLKWMILITLIGGCGVLSWYAAGVIAIHTVHSGESAPRFSEGNNAITLTGRSTILFFYLHGCPHCRRTLESLARLKLEKPELFSRKQILLVAEGQPEKNDTQLPTLMDDGHRIAKLYGIRYYPSVVTIDTNGRIDAVRVGELNISEEENILDGYVE